MIARACVYPRIEFVTVTEVILPAPSIVTFDVVPTGVNECDNPTPDAILIYAPFSASTNDAAKRISLLV